MDYIKNIIITELDVSLTNIKKELEQEKSNLALSKILDSVGRGNRRDVKYENLRYREISNRIFEKFINNTKFECVEDLNKFYKMDVKQYTFTDIPNRVVYYTPDLKEKCNNEIMILIVCELASALVVDNNSYYFSKISKKDVMQEEMRNTYYGETVNTKDLIANNYTKPIYDRLSIILRSIGYMDSIDTDNRRFYKRYLDIYKYYTNDKIEFPELSKAKLEIYINDNINKGKSWETPNNFLRISWRGILNYKKGDMTIHENNFEELIGVI